MWEAGPELELITSDQGELDFAKMEGKEKKDNKH